MKDKFVKYSSLLLTDEEIAEGAYKQYFGGEAEKWESRGAFQLAFLRHLGLRPDHRLLDVGCGVLRGGEHFIRYLDRGSYCGVDYNSDFIHAAGRIVQKDELLAEKNPCLRTIKDFEFAVIQAKFDFVIAFSVLNHCDYPEHRNFFRNIIGVIRDRTKIIITHAGHIAPAFIRTTSLRLNKQVNSARDLPGELDPQKWGLSTEGDFFPVLELVMRQKINEVIGEGTNGK